MARVKEALMDACEEVMKQAYADGVALESEYSDYDLFADIMFDQSCIPAPVLVIALQNECIRHGLVAGKPIGQ